MLVFKQFLTFFKVWSPIFKMSILRHRFNQDKSAASFCCQVGAWVQDMLFNFYLAKEHKNVNYSSAAEAEGKTSADMESLNFYIFIVCLTNMKKTVKVYFKNQAQIYRKTQDIYCLKHPHSSSCYLHTLSLSVASDTHSQTAIISPTGSCLMLSLQGVTQS